jgi:hypothetical protein
MHCWQMKKYVHLNLFISHISQFSPMMKTYLLIVLCFSGLIFSVHAQKPVESTETVRNPKTISFDQQPVVSDSLAFLKKEMPAEEINPYAPKNINQAPKPSYRKKFNGFHAYYLTSAEYIPAERRIYRHLLAHSDIPVAEITPVFYLGSISIMRNWMLFNFTYSFSQEQQAKTDSLISRLTQSSTTGRFGYNIYKNEKFLISAHAGLRYTQYHHLTGLNTRRVSLDHYLEVRDIDLRISQYSADLGISTFYLFHKSWSLGLFTSYLAELHDNPLIRSRENRINTGSRISNPLDNFVIGLGIGNGLHSIKRVPRI